MGESKVYILLDNEGCVVRIEGQYTLPDDLTGWILIESGEPCDRLNLAQTQYLDKPLLDEYGIPRYRYADGRITEREQEEIEANYPPYEPTTAEMADLAYISAELALAYITEFDL